MDQWVVLVFKGRLDLLVNRVLEVPRVTRVTVVSVVLKVFVERRDFLALAVLVVTRAIKVSVALVVSLAPVVFLECKEKLVMLVEWVLVAPVAFLVNVDCLALLVNVVLVVALALLVFVVLAALLENLARWDLAVSKAQQEMLESVVHRVFKVQQARWVPKERMASMARREQTVPRVFLELLVCLAARVPVVTRALLVLECQVLLDALALVVFQVSKAQQAAEVLQVPMVSPVCLVRRARTAKMVLMASMVRLDHQANLEHLVQRVQKETAVSQSCKSTSTL